MKVLFVIPGEPHGASMIFAKRQAASVAREGIATRAFYLRSRTSPSILRRDWLRFRRVAGRFRPDIVHAHFGTVTGLFAALASPCPVVITYRGSDLNPSPSVLWIRAALGRWMSQIAALGAGRIICVSEQLRDRLWWKKELVAIIPSGVDPAVFYPRPREDARRELGWGENDRVVLFNAGRSPQVKRLDLAERAFAELQRACPAARMHVLDGYVHPERVATIMNASDCLLLTSDWEGSPTVVQEALATNLPIVSVDAGDIRERLAGVRHVRVAARDPRALGQALYELVATPLRSDGRGRIGEFSATAIARRLKEIYRDATRSDEERWNFSHFLRSPR
jgi:glycosyltransferase involved in cell wall biosynthesis